MDEVHRECQMTPIFSMSIDVPSTDIGLKFVHQSLMMNCLDRSICILMHFDDDTVDIDYLKVKFHRSVSFERRLSMEILVNPIDEQMFDEFDKFDLSLRLMDRCVSNDHQKCEINDDEENRWDSSMLLRR